MEVAGEELDNQQVVHSAKAHVLSPEKESSHDSAKHAAVASNPIMSKEHARERIKDKGKEKINEKMKEPVFIEVVEFVDLDNYDATDKKLQCDSIDSNDNDCPNADGIGVRNGPGLYLQTMDSNDESASRLVALEVEEHYTMPTASIDDPLFNAVGKAPHANVVIVKQEAGWF